MSDIRYYQLLIEHAEEHSEYNKIIEKYSHSLTKSIIEIAECFDKSSDAALFERLSVDELSDLFSMVSGREVTPQQFGAKAVDVSQKATQDKPSDKAAKKAPSKNKKDDSLLKKTTQAFKKGAEAGKQLTSIDSEEDKEKVTKQSKKDLDKATDKLPPKAKSVVKNVSKEVQDAAKDAEKIEQSYRKSPGRSQYHHRVVDKYVDDASDSVGPQHEKTVGLIRKMGEIAKKHPGKTGVILSLLAGIGGAGASMAGLGPLGAKAAGALIKYFGHILVDVAGGKKASDSAKRMSNALAGGVLGGAGDEFADYVGSELLQPDELSGDLDLGDEEESERWGRLDPETGEIVDMKTGEVIPDRGKEVYDFSDAPGYDKSKVESVTNDEEFQRIMELAGVAALSEGPLSKMKDYAKEKGIAKKASHSPEELVQLYRKHGSPNDYDDVKKFLVKIGYTEKEITRAMNHLGILPVDMKRDVEQIAKHIKKKNLTNDIVDYLESKDDMQFESIIFEKVLSSKDIKRIFMKVLTRGDVSPHSDKERKPGAFTTYVSKLKDTIKSVQSPEGAPSGATVVGPFTDKKGNVHPDITFIKNEHGLWQRKGKGKSRIPISKDQMANVEELYKKQAKDKQILPLVKEIVNAMADRKGDPDWEKHHNYVKSIISKSGLSQDQITDALGRMESGQTMEKVTFAAINSIFEHLGINTLDFGIKAYTLNEGTVYFGPSRKIPLSEVNGLLEELMYGRRRS